MRTLHELGPYGIVGVALAVGFVVLGERPLPWTSHPDGGGARKPPVGLVGSKLPTLLRDASGGRIPDAKRYFAVFHDCGSCSSALDHIDWSVFKQLPTLLVLPSEADAVSKNIRHVAPAVYTVPLGKSSAHLADLFEHGPWFAVLDESYVIVRVEATVDAIVAAAQEPPGVIR